MWRALSDPTRRRVLDLLRERPRTTGELAGFFAVSRFAVMKHLAVLVRARLVLVRREGRERWNHLNAVPLQDAHDRWVLPYQARWASSLTRLRQFVETGEKGDRGMSPKSQAAPGVGLIRIEMEVPLEATPARVFAALTKDLAAWWGPPYLHDHAAKDLVMETELGGRVYEVGADGARWQWATVTALKQDALIELRGPLGMKGAVYGVITFTLEARGKGTRLQLSHRAIGEVDQKTQEGYQGGWGDLLSTRLKAFVERGERVGIRKKAR